MTLLCKFCSIQFHLFTQKWLNIIRKVNTDLNTAEWPSNTVKDYLEIIERQSNAILGKCHQMTKILSYMYFDERDRFLTESEALAKTEKNTQTGDPCRPT